MRSSSSELGNPFDPLTPKPQLDLDLEFDLDIPSEVLVDSPAPTDWNPLVRPTLELIEDLAEKRQSERIGTLNRSLCEFHYTSSYIFINFS